MDLLTQGLLGATVGELSSGKKLGNKAILWGAVAGLVPDMDTLITPFMDVASGLLFHRGISHSIFFALLFSPLFAWLIYFFYKKKYTYTIWLKLIFLSVFTHPLLDIFTTYGTGIFEPFSNARIGFGTISVVDLFYTTPLLFSVLVIPFLRKTNDWRYTINLGLFILSHSYLIFTVGNKLSIDNRVKNQLTYQEIAYTEFVSSPYILTNFLWNITAKTDDGFYVGSFHIFNKKKPIEFEFVPKNDHLIEKHSRKDAFQKLKFFSKEYYSIQKQNDLLYFYDLRYGKMHLPENDRFIFSFILKEDPFEVLRDYPETNFSKEDWKFMQKKIAGKI